MRPVKFDKANKVFGAPNGWDEQKHGKCLPLHVFVDTVNGCCVSCWQPSVAERAAIAAGAPVRLRVVGGQPPVWLYVEGAAEDDLPEPGSEALVLAGTYDNAKAWGEKAGVKAVWVDRVEQTWGREPGSVVYMLPCYWQLKCASDIIADCRQRGLVIRATGEWR